MFQSPTALTAVPPRDPGSHLTRRRHSTSLIFLTNQTSLVGSSPFRERLGSNRLPEKPRPRFEQFSSVSTTCRTKVFSLIPHFPSRS
ncbi:hypothetical protein PV326_011929 [Microctonus aethiopoides]|uniref:Uncharacterized protein n=1 Tax=Microctonus aethiopoides TaxID=144406 RepID=A0AA39F9Y6_9HYME|nr:hypothetical protein PV326_011929 [Microctonus aethiopoides]KAK0165544.1 hypothetical protein PV328_004051 [Microctonus aethiopoides]